MALTQTAGITISDVPCTFRLLRVKTRSWSFCWPQKPILMSQIDGGAPLCKTPFQVGRIHALISSDPKVNCLPVYASHMNTNKLCCRANSLFMHRADARPPHSCMCPSGAGAGRCSPPPHSLHLLLPHWCAPADCRFCLDS